MKKIFTLVAAAVMALAVNAKDYEGTFSISIMGGAPQIIESSITVDPVETTDDTLPYNITLNNLSILSFTFEKITISNVLADDTDGMGGYKFFQEETYTAQIVNSPISIVNSVDITIKDGSCINEETGDLYLNINMNVPLGDGIPVVGTFGNDPFAVNSYTDKMNVTMEGKTVAEGIEATIDIQKQISNGNYTLSLKNFMLGEVGVGNITIKDVEITEGEDGVQKVTAKSLPIEVTPGDIEGVNWALGTVINNYKLKADINGEIENGKLNATIDLPAMKIQVIFGEKYIAAGIDSPAATVDNGVEAIYDLSGRKLNEMQKGINIVRKADGTTVKVLKK